MGVVRPPELRLHGACFVVARLGLIAWFAGFIGSCVVLSKSGICVVGKGGEIVCRTRVLGVVVSGLGL